MSDYFSGVFTPAAHDGLIALITLLVIVVIVAVLTRLVFSVLLRVAQRDANTIFAAFVRRARGPSLVNVPLIAALFLIPALTFPDAIDAALQHLVGILTIAATGWTAIAVVGLATDIIKTRYHIDAEDNLRARSVETRIDILSRSLITIVTLVAVAAVLMTFPPIRALGATLLASAGVAGLAIGLAARPLFENLVAGIQIALTQPIRLDDVVIVESEYGKIEEIGATYVVVRLWDMRRMVLPLTYFIEKPFQNWTRTGAALLGTVMIYTDYTMPVAELRTTLPKLLEHSKLWDGAVQNVQVTDATENTMQIRILVSARNSSDLFDLRCDIRERMIAFLQEKYPDALPQTRFVADAPARALAGAGPG